MSDKDKTLEDLSGLAKGKTIEDIASMHDVTVDFAKKQLATGTKVELEHTKDKDFAKAIAMDHLYEDIIYYEKLKTIEESRYHIRNIIKEGLKGIIKEDKPVSAEYLRGLLTNTTNKSAIKTLTQWANTKDEMVMLTDKQYQLLQDIKAGGPKPKMYSPKN